MRSIKPVLYLAVFVLLIAATHTASSQTDQPKPEPILGGELDAPIRMEVFSDFECPACREFYVNTVRQVLNDYCSAGKVCVVYREFPLKQHKYSRQAACSSKAAQLLGRKQWQSVMDALYDNQAKWTLNGSFDDFVFKALGADEYFKLRKMLLDPSIDAAVEGEVSLGQNKQVTSTPTIFFYYIGKEQKVVGGLPYPVMKSFFDSIVK